MRCDENGALTSNQPSATRTNRQPNPMKHAVEMTMYTLYAHSRFVMTSPKAGNSYSQEQHEVSFVVDAHALVNPYTPVLSCLSTVRPMHVTYTAFQSE